MMDCRLVTVFVLLVTLVASTKQSLHGRRKRFTVGDAQQDTANWLEDIHQLKSQYGKIQTEIVNRNKEIYEKINTIINMFVDTITKITEIASGQDKKNDEMSKRIDENSAGIKDIVVVTEDHGEKIDELCNKTHEMSNKIDENVEGIKNLVVVTGINGERINETTDKVEENRKAIKDVNNLANGMAIAIQSIVQTNNQQNGQINSVQVALNQLKLNIETQVHFSAVVENDVVVEPDVAVVFDVVRSDVGGGYNKETGEFTCPVAGDYQFDLRFMTQNNEVAKLMVYHNDQSVLRVVAQDDKRYNLGSGSVIITMEVGDVVVVKPTTKSKIRGLNYSNPSFIGVLLSKS